MKQPPRLIGCKYIGELHVVGNTGKVIAPDGKRVEVHPKVQEVLDRIARNVSRQQRDRN